MYIARFFAAALLAGFFAACAQSPQNAQSEETPSDTAVNHPAQPAAGTEDSDSSRLLENQLPSSVLGTFDQTQEACSSGTFTALTVLDSELQFYYGYAEINSVTRRDEGYDIDATFFQQEGAMEVRPEAATYRIEPNDQNNSILFENGPTGQPPSRFVRCDKP